MSPPASSAERARILPPQRAHSAHAEQAVRGAAGVDEAVPPTPGRLLRFEGSENEERRKSPTLH